MVQGTSVVTPQRFSHGFTYKDYIAQIKVNKDLFEKYYNTASAQITPADVDFFKKAVNAHGGPAKVLVLGEDWCPDVHRGLPLIAKVAEVSGMDIRIFPRDLNLDIMNEFLNQGQFQSLPTLVFYTKDDKYILHWIERPAQVGKEQAELRAKTTEEFRGRPDEELRTEIRKRINESFPHWQRVTIDDWRSLFAKFGH